MLSSYYLRSPGVYFHMRIFKLQEGKFRLQDDCTSCGWYQDGVPVVLEHVTVSRDQNFQVQELGGSRLITRIRE